MVRLGGVLLGVALEWVQKTWMPLRSWDDLDILADLIGVLLGSWLSGQMRKGKEKRG
jgi:VanZ family protein